ncbi:16178_t:CDS:2, partial [Funneliformis geosporum]
AEFEDEASSSEEEDNIILQTVLIQRSNTRYLNSEYTINKPQICVELQLAVFLCRLSSTRSLFAVSSQFEIGEGTVILYIKRVIQAIVIQKETFVKWSTLEECKKVHKGFEDLGGLKNIIKARDFDVGWPASVHDARVFRNSSFYKDYSNLIKGNDYLLNFNHFHSSHQVVVENAFRRLKARFRVLRNLDIKTVKIEVLFTLCVIILYNFLEINMDIWEVTFNDNIDYENDDISNYIRENDDVLKKAEQTKRNLNFYQHFL